MRFVYITSIALAMILAGCQKKKTDDFVSDSLKNVMTPQGRRNTGNNAPQNTSASSTQTITPVNAPKVPPIGIKVDNDQIIIDTKQTKKFLESLTKKMDQSFKKVAEDLKKNKIDKPNETGIIITQDRIEVDLNKTQKFMNKWIKSMEAVGKQLDSIAKELDNSFKP